MVSKKNLFIFNFNFMNLFIKKTFIFSVPILFYLFMILIIDPFNFIKSNSLISKDIKNKISSKVEPHLFKMIAYESNPTKNIVLGDSRSNRLFKIINEKSDSWSSLAYNGCSINEIVQTFDWLKTNYQLDTVLVGINFNLYNKYNHRSWIIETIERKNSLFSYAFSKYSMKSSFLIMKSIFLNENIDIDKPNLNRSEFWIDKIDKYGPKFYENYLYPHEYYIKLKEISFYCQKNNIHLIFWIPPNYIDIQNLINRYDLLNQNEKFINDISKIGELYNFNISNKLTRNKLNFTDPTHFNSDVGEYIYSKIFNNNF